MYPSPASHCSPASVRATSPRGGNLVRAFQLHPDQFYSSESVEQFLAHNPDPDKVAGPSLTAALAGAATNRRCYPAKSRPFVFPEVNHVAHSKLSVAHTTGVTPE